MKREKRKRKRERDCEVFQSIVKTTSVYVIGVYFPAGNQNRTTAIYKTTFTASYKPDGTTQVLVIEKCKKTEK